MINKRYTCKLQLFIKFPVRLVASSRTVKETRGNRRDSEIRGERQLTAVRNGGTNRKRQTDRQTGRKIDRQRGRFDEVGPISPFVGTRTGVNVPKMQCIHASSSLCVRHNSRLNCDSAIIVAAHPPLFYERHSNSRGCTLHRGPPTRPERNLSSPKFQAKPAVVDAPKDSGPECLFSSTGLITFAPWIV